MATEGRTAPAAIAPEELESAGFVRVVTRPDGDALAAGGVLAGALAAIGTPFQVSVARTVADRSSRVDETADVSIAVGAVEGDRVRLDADRRPATLVACDLADRLGTSPDPALALAGVVAAGGSPDAGDAEGLLQAAIDAVDRRPGVAVPTADPVDGLAHSTRIRGPWSGDPDATREALAGVAPDGSDLAADAEPELAEEDRRAIASLVAIDVVAADGASESAPEALGTALRPYATPDGVFETIGGYADVLEATARVAPGTGVALAMGHDVREAALDAWREHGRRTHAALSDASTGRYDGLSVVGVDDGPVESVARLAVDYRSPEATVVAIGDGEAALATREGRSLPIEGIARELESEAGECTYDVGPRRGYLRYDPDVDDATVIAVARDAL